MKKIYVLLVTLICLTTDAVQAQSNWLYSFTGAGGKFPYYGSLTTVGHKFYGMTNGGGAHSAGCIFSIDTTGTAYKDVFDFDTANGLAPAGSLTLVGKTLFGMTTSGGAHNLGLIFSIDTDGTQYKDMLDFNAVNGSNPYGSLVFVSPNWVMGMTALGGLNGDGLVFRIDTNGTLYKDLLDFNGANGKTPYGSLVVQYGIQVDLYGMTQYGGAHDSGCIFRVDTTGSTYVDMHDFKGTDGRYPLGSLVFNSNNNVLFGMTSSGGTVNAGTIFEISDIGTPFKVEYSFAGADGKYPNGSLCISGNVLYGMTSGGGANSDGVVFSVDSNGTGYKDMLDFNDVMNGEDPSGSLTLSGNFLYGMAEAGGANGDGVIFGFNYKTVGINEINTNGGKITVYPNPNTGSFTVAVSGTIDKSTVEVYNILGQQVFTHSLSLGNNTMDMNTSNGVYLYRILSDNGNLVGEGKLIIQK